MGHSDKFDTNMWTSYETWSWSKIFFWPSVASCYSMRHVPMTVVMTVHCDAYHCNVNGHVVFVLWSVSLLGQHRHCSYAVITCAWVKLLLSPNLVAVGLSVCLVGLNIDWDCLDCSGLWAHVTGGNFHCFIEAASSPLAQASWVGLPLWRLWKSLLMDGGCQRHINSCYLNLQTSYHVLSHLCNMSICDRCHHVQLACVIFASYFHLNG